jgi:hypothetical protein
LFYFKKSEISSFFLDDFCNGFFFTAKFLFREFVEKIFITAAIAAIIAAATAFAIYEEKNLPTVKKH